MNFAARLFIFFGLLATCLTFAAEGTLQADDLWIREAPPAARVLAGYGRFRNPSPYACVLTGASSDTFERVEVHRTIIEDDVARMVRQSNISIASGASFVLEPNGYHLMLIGPKKPLRSGDMVKLTLHFDSGVTQEFLLEVRSTVEHSN